jgi:hypothetical protein
MKRILPATGMALLLAAAAVSPAGAGCVKGAVVGAIAGHYAHHHAILGAMAGCAIGHHMAVKAREEKAAQAQHPAPPSTATPQGH